MMMLTSSSSSSTLQSLGGLAEPLKQEPVQAQCPCSCQERHRTMIHMLQTACHATLTAGLNLGFGAQPRTLNPHSCAGAQLHSTW